MVTARNLVLIPSESTKFISNNETSRSIKNNSDSLASKNLFESFSIVKDGYVNYFKNRNEPVYRLYKERNVLSSKDKKLIKKMGLEMLLFNFDGSERRFIMEDLNTTLKHNKKNVIMYIDSEDKIRLLLKR